MTKKGLQTPGLYAYRFGNETGSTTMVNQFEDVLSIITKGQQLKYGAGLAYYMGIDLSGNSLTGEVPSGITSLDALINLNLSSNYLVAALCPGGRAGICIHLRHCSPSAQNPIKSSRSVGV